MSPEWWVAGEGQGVWKLREWGWMRGLKECGDLCDDTVVVVIPEHQHQEQQHGPGRPDHSGTGSATRGRAAAGLCRECENKFADQSKEFSGWLSIMI